MKPLTLIGVIKTFGLVMATIVATITAINLWPKYYWVAHRGYVDEKSQELLRDVGKTLAPIIPTVNELAIGRLETEISTVDSEIASWTIKITSETDPQTKGMMEQRIKELHRKKEFLNNKLGLLRGNAL